MKCVLLLEDEGKKQRAPISSVWKRGRRSADPWLGCIWPQARETQGSFGSSKSKMTVWHLEIEAEKILVSPWFHKSQPPAHQAALGYPRLLRDQGEAQGVGGWSPA